MPNLSDRWSGAKPQAEKAQRDKGLADYLAAMDQAGGDIEPVTGPSDVEGGGDRG